ncbi:MAG: hydrogenase nickel incorporation protein HypB, partial [Candidatus Ranarchaeia archaeon]
MVLKHPFTFIHTDIVLINKIDLVEQMEVDPAKLENDLKNINPDVKTFHTNARTGEGIIPFLEYLELM